MRRKLFGHCAAMSSTKRVVVAGGYSPGDINDYNENVDIYDIETKTWTTKQWLKRPIRMDSSCLNVDLGYLFTGGGSGLGIRKVYITKVNEEGIKIL